MFICDFANTCFGKKIWYMVLQSTVRLINGKMNMDMKLLIKSFI